MKLKHFFIATMMVFGASLAYSQQIDDRLLKSYPEAELKALYEADREKYDLLVYALENGLQIVNVGKGKAPNLVGTVTLPEGKYTFADLGLRIAEMEQYYSVEGTDSVLMVKSYSLLNRLKNNK